MPQLELANLSNIDIPLSALLYRRAYQQSFETGETDLVAYNCLQSIETNDVYDGNYSLRITVLAGETGYIETPTRPVAPRQLVRFSFVHKELQNVASMKLIVVWRRGAGGTIGTTEINIIPSAEWRANDMIATAPKNVATMAIRIEITADIAGDAIVLLDDIIMDMIGLTFNTDAEGNVKINIAVDEVGLAREATLQGIKAQTDRFRFDTDGNLLGAINKDNVGLAKESTLSSIQQNIDTKLSTRASETTLQAVDSKITDLRKALQSVGQDKILTIPDNPSNLDIKLSDIKTVIQQELVRYAKLQIYDSSTSTWKNVSDNMPVAIEKDNVGLLKEGGNINILNFPSDYPDSITHSKLDDLRKALQSIGQDRVLTVPDNPSNLDIKLSQIDASLKTVLPRYARLQIYKSSSSTWEDIVDYVPISIDRDSVGLLKDGGNVNIANFPSDYPDSGTHNRLDAIKNALQSIGSDKFLTKPDNPPNLDTKLSTINTTLQNVLPRYSRLQIYSSATGTWIDVSDRLPISIDEDKVGLLKEGGSINIANLPSDYPDSGTHSRLDDLKRALQSIGTDKFLTKPDNPPNLDVSLSSVRDSLKPARDTPTQELSSYTISGGGMREITKTGLDGWSAIIVTVRASYSANATKGIRIRWLYSQDGASYDDAEYAEKVGNYEDLEFEAGKTKQGTIIIPILTPNVKIQIVNLDPSYNVVVDAWITKLR